MLLRVAFRAEFQGRVPGPSSGAEFGGRVRGLSEDAAFGLDAFGEFRDVAHRLLHRGDAAFQYGRSYPVGIQLRKQAAFTGRTMNRELQQNDARLRSCCCG